MRTWGWALLLGISATGWGQVRIPQGTPIHARLTQDVGRGSAGRALALWVVEPVVVDNTLVIERGARAEAAAGPGRSSGWWPTRVQAIDGTWIPLRAEARASGGKSPLRGWDGDLYSAGTSPVILGNWLGGEGGAAPGESAWFWSRAGLWLRQARKSAPDVVVSIVLVVLVLAISHRARQTRRCVEAMRRLADF